MNLLAFETSTEVGSVALFVNDHFFSEKISQNQKKHTEFITLAVEQLLSESNLKINDIDSFAVSIGPGSFTGIRVSVNAVRTYVQLLNVKASMYNSLELLAEQTQSLCISMINAYKNMVYIGAYKSGKCLVAPTAIPVVQIGSYIQHLARDDQFIFVGDGYLKYEKILQEKIPKYIIRDSSLSDFPSAKILGKLAFKDLTKTYDWKSIIPLYIRASEAEENLKKI